MAQCSCPWKAQTSLTFGGSSVRVRHSQSNNFGDMGSLSLKKFAHFRPLPLKKLAQLRLRLTFVRCIAWPQQVALLLNPVPSAHHLTQMIRQRID